MRSGGTVTTDAPTHAAAHVATERPPTGPLTLDPERYGARHFFAEFPSDVARAMGALHRDLPGDPAGNLFGGIARFAQDAPLLAAGSTLLAATVLLAFSAQRSSRPAGRRAPRGRSRPEGGCTSARAAPR